MFKIGDTFAAVRITIVDYYLKPVSRISSHQHKEARAFEKYIRFSLKM